jgi:hypothetical protein
MDDITVRVGTAADFNEMMRLSIAATEENAFIAPDIALLANQVWKSLTHQGGVVGVIGDTVGGKLEGAILLNIGPVWYSAEPVLEEKAIFVDPEYRAAKGGRARKLGSLRRRWRKNLSCRWQSVYCQTAGQRPRFGSTREPSASPQESTSFIMQRLV